MLKTKQQQKNNRNDVLKNVFKTNQNIKNHFVSCCLLIVVFNENLQKKRCT